MSRSKAMKRTIGLGSALMMTMLLAGCTDQFYDDRMQGYQPELPHQTYPIEVVKGEAKLHIPVRGGKLSMKERMAIRHLAGRANSVTAPVVVIRPAGSAAAEVRAAEITRILVDEGVAPERIRHRAGSRGGKEISISFHRKFAVTRECGDWSKPITRTKDNRVYPDFGCAHQHNIAAQVDNPEDFERPRVMDRPDADARDTAMQKYRKAEDYTSQWPSGYKIQIAEELKSITK